MPDPRQAMDGDRDDRNRKAEPLKDAETTGTSARRTTRMTPEERKRTLLDKAVDYFAEEGFDGGTRGLARQMGITQPLIYRYFPSKDDLINEVYRAVYLSQWKDGWTAILRDRARPLKARLTDFYASYNPAVFRRPWMRIFFFAGLRGLDINQRYVNRVLANVLVPICEEMRAELGIDTDAPVTEAELDLVWMMHGAIFYQGIREHIYRVEARVDHARNARLGIAMYLAVAAEEVPRAVAAATGRGSGDQQPAHPSDQPMASGPSAP